MSTLSTSPLALFATRANVNENSREEIEKAFDTYLKTLEYQNKLEGYHALLKEINEKIKPLIGSNLSTFDLVGAVSMTLDGLMNNRKFHSFADVNASFLGRIRNISTENTKTEKVTLRPQLI